MATKLRLAQEILNIIYPVGSIYLSVNSTNPSSLFGGTWVQWGAGKVPVGVDTNDSNFNTVEKTGGEKTHKLTVDEMPSHTHDQYVTANSGNAGVRKDYNQDANTSVYYQCQTGSRGGGQAHNNLQPYITCFMWKRTA